MTRVTDPSAASSTYPPPDLSDQLRTSVGRLWRRLRAERSADDLSDLQYSVLAHIVRQGPLPFTRIAADAHVTPTSITRVAEHLTGAGLAERTRDGRDGRIWVLAPTPIGTDLVLDVRHERSQWLSRALAQLTAAELDTLTQAAPLLLRLAQADTSVRPTPPATAPTLRTGGDRA